MTIDVGDGEPLEGDVVADADPQEVVDRIADRAAARAGVSEEREYGRVGRPFDRRSPFYVGFTGALGVVVAATLAWLVYLAGHILVLLGVAFFIAVGLDPAVTWVSRRHVPRWGAVVIVLVAALALLGGFVGLAVPVIVHQATGLAHHLPGYLHSLDNRHTALGRLNARYDVVSRLQKFITAGGGKAVAGGVVGVGKAVFGALYSGLVVLVVSIYLLADLPRFRRAIYHVAPLSRRPRMVVLTNEIFSRVGGYVLGNLVISVISAVGTLVWAEIFGIPDPVLLGLLVGILDLIPIVGSTIGGVIVALVALAAVSLPVAVATVVFYVGYRLFEDYVLTPRIMGHTVDVPGLVTVVAVLIGGALLGIAGALVAIPVAAGIKLLVQELVHPRLEEL
jgi:predicted PurR-regulated permease PerM